MKNLLLIVFSFLSIGVFAQKELQPYHYVNTSDEKANSIIITAKAKSASNITFTLNNPKNEKLKNVKGEDLVFTVSPFIEVVFREKLKEVYETLDETNEVNKSSTGVFNFTEANRSTYVKEVRNIYQFFNSLSNTYFQYDNEPVAGELVYSFDTNVTLNRVLGFDTEDYFNMRAKHIRKNVLDSEKDFKVSDFRGVSADDFLMKVDKDDDFKKEIVNFHNNCKRGDKGLRFNHKSKFKRYLRERLKEKYNEYEIESILKNDFFTTYIINKAKVLNQEKDIDSLNKVLTELVNDVQSLNNQEKDNQEVKGAISKLEIDINKLELINSKILGFGVYRSKYEEVINKYEEVIVSIKTNGNISEEHYNELKKSNDLTIKKLVELIDGYRNDKKLNELNKKIEDLKSKEIIEKLEEVEKRLKYTDDLIKKEININEDRIKKVKDSIKSKSKKKKALQVDIDTLIVNNQDKLHKLPVWSFLIDDIEIDINDGFIEHLTVVGSIKKPVFNENRVLAHIFDKQVNINNNISNSISFDVLEDLRKVLLEVKSTKDKEEKATDNIDIKKKEFLDDVIKAIDDIKLNKQKELVNQYSKEKDKSYTEYVNKIDFIGEKIIIKLNEIKNKNFNKENVSSLIDKCLLDLKLEEHKKLSNRVDKESPSIDDNIKTAIKKNDLSVFLEAFYEEETVKNIFPFIDKQLKFENEFPIGFSSKTDFSDLHHYNLYSFEGVKKVFTLPISEVITNYIQHHQNDRLDFSPKDQIVKLGRSENNSSIELKKETSSKILNLNVFSDFVGFGENGDSGENGVLQFEVEKFLPLWTKRFQLNWGRSSNIGLFNYTNFKFTWAKLSEGDDKDFQLKKVTRTVNNEFVTEDYITYLDIIRHENISIGVDLNIVSLEFPLIKTRLEINAGLHYARLNVVDKVTQGENTTTNYEKDINFLRWYPDFILRVRPEERFGGYLRFRPFRLAVPTNQGRFYSVSSEKDFLANGNDLGKSWMHRMELSTYFTPSAKSDNRFFFRYRYTTESTWESNGFSEFQVGYLAYLKF